MFAKSIAVVQTLALLVVVATGIGQTISTFLTKCRDQQGIPARECFCQLQIRDALQSLFGHSPLPAIVPGENFRSPGPREDEPRRLLFGGAKKVFAELFRAIVCFRISSLAALRH